MTDSVLHERALKTALKLKRITEEQALILKPEYAKYASGIYTLMDQNGNIVCALTEAQIRTHSKPSSGTSPNINPTVRPPNQFSAQDEISERIRARNLIVEDEQAEQSSSVGMSVLAKAKIIYFVLIAIFGSIITFQLKSLVELTAALNSYSRSPKYEYRVESPGDASFDSEMEKIGAEGWELVTSRRAVTEGVPSYELIFKRRLAGFASASADRIMNQPIKK